MRIRKLRSFSEACVLGTCLMLIFFSMAQVFLLNSRSRPFRPDTGVDSKLSKTTANDDLRKQEPDIGVIRQRDTLKRAAISSSNPAGVSTKSLVAQVKYSARTKAQKEIRELERSLVTLMRQNSRTPQQSQAEMEIELYGRRVGRIIQQAAQEATKLATRQATSSVLSASEVQGGSQNVPFFQPQSSNSRDFGTIASQRRAFSDDSQLESQNRMNLGHKLHPIFGKNRSVPSDIKSASQNIGQSAFSGKRDESLYSPKAQNVTRTIRKSKNTLGGYRIDEEDKRRFVLDLINSNNVSDVKLDSVLSEYPSKNFEQHWRPVNLQPKVLCPAEPNNLVGNMTDVNLTQPLDIDDIMAEHADVLEGGEWAPSDCVSRHRVAFVIPYRDRWGHLKSLLYYLIPVLKRQQIHFRMFVVEQFGNDTFNKGRIMNAAFREALKLFDFQCVTFHDVDLVPEDDRNMYSCAEMPKHMSIGIDKFNYLLPYDGLVGGVLMFRTEHFQQVNGYSNMYWGWGAEDDDMTTRILHQGLRIYRPPSNIARYKMVKHDGRKTSEVSVRMKLLRSAARRSKMEGLNNIQYNLLYTHTEKLFTHFLVDIGHP